jgi:hypothetical protein
MLEKLLVALGIGGVLAIVVGLFIIGPILTILAVNHLFGTAIAINFWNWVSVAWLHIVVASTTSTSKS